MNNMDIERGSRGKYGASVFFEAYNDFDVYIEDTAEGYAKIFASILSRAMSSNVTLERVFPLGARGEVLSAARENLRAPKTRGAVYIVDGDLYLLSGEFEDVPTNTVVLPRYCIENFLLEEVSLINVMNEECHDLSIADLKRMFDYEGWLDRSRPALKRLFEAFAISHYMKSGIPTVARGYKSICADAHGEINSSKVDTIINEIRTTLIADFGAEAFARAQQLIGSKIESDYCFVSKYVSGKDYTLPLLVTRLKSITSSKASNINLKIRMSLRCDIRCLSTVVQEMSNILRMPTIVPSGSETSPPFPPA